VTVQELVDAVLQEGQFDATQAQALRWLSTRQQKMVTRARALRKSTTIQTMAGQQEYLLPEGIVQIMEVRVDGVVYGRALHSDIGNSFIVLEGEGGVVAPEEESGGELSIALIPTPTTGGKDIVVRASMTPPELDVGDNNTLKVPLEHQDALISGAIATALQRLESRPDLAQSYETQFADACEEWRQQISRRYRGTGPARIRLYQT
jgi:hypothetical protein